jgi:glutaconate CoA-transferase, subunit A
VAVSVKPDKTTDLEQAAALVADGDTVAVGGGLSHRVPMALVRELCRQRRRRLRVVGSAHGIDVDLLVAAGVVAVVEQSYVGYEQDFGLAPAFRAAAESGRVAVRETCCYTLLQQLRAAEYGIPFMPVRGVLGSGVMGLHPEFREIECPLTGERLVAVPALAPDVALIHAPLADTQGNVAIPRPYVLDERFAMAAKRVVVSAERVVAPGEIDPERVTIPYFAVTAVTEAPMGAHPTSCYPDYTYDRAAIERWVGAAATAKGAASYLAYVVAQSEEHYRRRHRGYRARLAAWSESPERWQELMA